LITDPSVGDDPPPLFDFCKEGEGEGEFSALSPPSLCFKLGEEVEEEEKAKGEREGATLFFAVKMILLVVESSLGLGT
jgi:hypothetical protein